MNKQISGYNAIVGLFFLLLGIIYYAFVFINKPATKIYEATASSLKKECNTGFCS